MKLPYCAPELNVILFRPAEPVAQEAQEDETEAIAASHDNGYVDPWSLDPEWDWSK